MNSQKNRLVFAVWVTLLVMVMGSPTQGKAQAVERTHIAVIVDDSGSMSGFNGSPTDKDGIAAYAASQVFRMAPRTAKMGLFTFSDIEKKGRSATPLFRLSDASRDEAASAVTRLLTTQPDNRHPYSHSSTPCKTAVQTAVRWLQGLSDQTTARSTAKSTIFFLTDGACSRRQDLTATDVSGVELFVLDFSDGKLSPGVKRVSGSDRVEAVKSKNALSILNVLESFGAVMDSFEGRSGNTRRTLKSGQLSKLSKDTAQAYRVHVFTTATGSKDDNQLFAKLPPRVVSEKRVQTGQWSWWRAEGDKRSTTTWRKGSQSVRFHWAYLELFPSELEGLKDLLAEPGRDNIFRPEWLIRYEQRRFVGSCQDRTAETEELKTNRLNRGRAEICAVVSPMVTLPDDTEAPMTFRTLKVAYLGDEPAAGYPEPLQVMFLEERVYQGKRHDRKESPPTLGKVSDGTPRWSYDTNLPICSMSDEKDKTLNKSLGDKHLTYRLANGHNRDTPRPITRVTTSTCFNADADDDGEISFHVGGTDCNDDPAQGGKAVNSGQTSDTCGDGLDNDCDNELSAAELARLNAREETFSAICEGVWCTCKPGTRRGQSGENPRFKRYVEPGGTGVDEGCPNADTDGAGNHDPSETDADGDGCQDANDDTPTDYCNPTSREECRDQCEWALIGQPATGDMVIDVGDMTSEGSVERRLNIDPSSLKFDCGQAAERSSFTFKFTTSAADPCFQVSGDETLTVDRSSGSLPVVTLNVRRDAQCGTVYSTSEGREDPKKKIRHALTMSAALEADTGFPVINLTIKGHFNQSLDVNHDGLLRDDGDRDAQVLADQTKFVALKIRPVVGDWGTPDPRHLRPVHEFPDRDQLNVSSVTERLFPFLREELQDPELADDHKKGGWVHGLLFSDCSTEPSMEESGENNTGAQVFRFKGETSKKVCISLNPRDLAICPGGGLFSLCDGLDTTTLESSQKPTLTLKDLGHGGSTLVRQGGVGGKAERTIQVDVVIERTFMHWLIPAPVEHGGGPGWWWLVFLAFAFICWGSMSTEQNCFDDIKGGPFWFYTGALSLVVVYVLLFIEGRLFGLFGSGGL